MKCQNCGKNEANTHLKQNINGNISESYLCSECAEKLGYGGIFSGYGSFGNFGNLGLFDSIFGSLLGGSGFASASLPSAVKCKKCGSTFGDISERGTVGCADCYDTFRERLAPSIERIHGRARHIGKGAAAKPQREAEVKAKTEAKPVSKEDKIKNLRAQMQKAVDKQDYEQAAVLRDRIKELEGLK
ncbi:MAG: UvrB/UvrC motif-containing protein [Clostridia bacterium]|nr:UvrB/UvrC motif-containing protein [Clostridia bacterium]